MADLLAVQAAIGRPAGGVLGHALAAAPLEAEVRAGGAGLLESRAHALPADGCAGAGPPRWSRQWSRRRSRDGLRRGCRQERSSFSTPPTIRSGGRCLSGITAGVPERGLVPQPLPMIPDRSEGGSTDIGDVSWTTLTVAFLYPSFPLGIGLHTWPVTVCGGMSIGTKSAVGAATILTRLAQDLMTDEDLRRAARADFAAKRAGKAYVSPLVGSDPTAGITQAVATNPWMALMRWSHRRSKQRQSRCQISRRQTWHGQSYSSRIPPPGNQSPDRLASLKSPSPSSIQRPSAPGT